ncbi:sigma-70 family RNA polymerase sigma factor [Paracoccaceae bacterium]|nr:sigma-70 family RNA polymerase sigma factor [Paracoccaceae bacterium]
MNKAQKKKFIETELSNKKVRAKLFQKVEYLQYRNGYRDNAEAEDIVQETILRCLEKHEGFNGDYFVAWAKQILTNLYFDRGRRKTNYSDIISDLTKQSETYSNPDTCLEVATKIAYEDCIDTLTKKQYEVFFKQIKERDEKTGKPLDTKSLSKRLKMPQGTLLPLLSRAKQTLAKCLQNQFLEDAST